MKATTLEVADTCETSLSLSDIAGMAEVSDAKSSCMEVTTLEVTEVHETSPSSLPLCDETVMVQAVDDHEAHKTRLCIDAGSSSTADLVHTTILPCSVQFSSTGALRSSRSALLPSPNRGPCILRITNLPIITGRDS